MKLQLMPNHLRPMALRVAKHEAGHFIVGRVHGFWCGDCSATIVHANGAYHGGADIKLACSLTSLEDVRGYLERRIQVLYAGAVAESLTSLGKVDNQIAIDRLKSAAKDDYSKARELIQLVRSIQHPECKSEPEWQAQLNEIDSKMWNAAAVCVEAEHELIQGVAERLTDELMGAGLGATATLRAEEVNSMPAIVDRFGADPKP